MSTADPAPASTPTPIAARLGIPVAMLAVYWSLTFAMQFVEVNMLARFGTRCLSWALLMVGFLLWALFNRVLSRRDRRLALLLLLVATVLVSFGTHRSITLQTLLMEGFPPTLTVWTACLLVSRSLAQTTQRRGIVVATAITLGMFLLLRSHGFNALQRAELDWRWIPSPEELFLAARTPSSRNSSSSTWELQPGDWPEFLGPERRGVATGLSFSNDVDWSRQPPRLIWKRRIGPGWSSVIVVDGRLVTQEQRGESECVVCYQAATGDELWVSEETSRFTEAVSGAGPRGTPTYADGRIFALGAKGNLHCLAASDGQRLWSHDLVAETKAAIPMWGFSASPLVVDGLVIVPAGGTGDLGVVAFHAASGERAWTLPSGPQTYSSPQLVTLHGERQVLVFDNRSLSGVQISTGRRLWEFPKGAEYSIPMLQPHLLNDHELLVSLEPDLVRLDIQRTSDQWSVATRWRSNRLKPGFNEFIVDRDQIVGLDDGILCALDLATGIRKWKKNRYGHGQLLHLADANQLLILSDSGVLALWRLADETPREATRFTALQGKTWNHMAFAHDRLYVRNGEEMACYEFASR